MQVVTRQIVLGGRNDSFKITPIGDIHMGGRDCNLKLLRRVVDRIKNDHNHFWIGMGDYAEYIGVPDPRLDLREISPETTAADLQDLAHSQSRMVYKELEPIKDRCLGLIVGNHENKVALRLFQDIHRRFCDLMQNALCTDMDLGYSAIIKLRVKRGPNGGSRLVKIYVHHGAGAGRKKGSKVNRLEDLAASFPFCDIYLMGHVHDRLCHISTVLDCTDRNDNLIARARAFGITGTFKETYCQGTSGYGEIVQYPPTALGVITLTIQPFHKFNTEEKIVINAHSGTDGMPV